jgi:hypothetical protein
MAGALLLFMTVEDCQKIRFQWIQQRHDTFGFPKTQYNF